MITAWNWLSDHPDGALPVHIRRSLQTQPLFCLIDKKIKGHTRRWWNVVVICYEVARPRAYYIAEFTGHKISREDKKTAISLVMARYGGFTK